MLITQKQMFTDALIYIGAYVYPVEVFAYTGGIIYRTDDYIGLMVPLVLRRLFRPLQPKRVYL
jgi:hypothetical protein